MSHKLVCLLGASASGKDSIMRVLVKEYGFKPVISTTTRPIRSNETQGKDYYFVNDNLFNWMLENDKLIEHRTYNTIQDGKSAVWQYGITKSEINLSEGNHVVVCDLKGLEDLTKYFGKENIISIFIAASENSRRLRAIARDEKFEEKEWQRRKENDDKIFENVAQKVDYWIENDRFHFCVDDLVVFLKNNLTSI